MEQLDVFIEQEKQDNPYIKELIEVFFNMNEELQATTFGEDVKNLVDAIEINEEEIKKVPMNYEYMSRKRLYNHLIRNGAGSLFNKEKQISEMIYIWYLKFKQEITSLDKQEKTEFTKRMIELFNQSATLKIAQNEWQRKYTEWIYFQIMIKEIQKIKKAEKVE